MPQTTQQTLNSLPAMVSKVPVPVYRQHAFEMDNTVMSPTQARLYNARSVAKALLQSTAQHSPTKWAHEVLERLDKESDRDAVVTLSQQLPPPS